jgi:hypothetical protein
MSKLFTTAFRQALRLFQRGPTAPNISRAAERVMRAAAKARKASG